MPELQRLPADCTADDIVEVSDRDGGVIVDGWIQPELLERFNAELEPWLESHAGTNSGSAASDDFLGHRTRRLQGLCAKAPSFVEIMTEDRIVEFAQAVLGPISPTIILNDGEVIDIGPGESAQPMHRDDDAWNFARPPGPMIVNTIAALVDVSPAMGGTLVVPGSHRWDTDRVPDDSEITACDLPAGSTLFFRGDTLHAGGANTTTNRNRRALSTGFCCGWLRPVENSYTNVPPDVAATLPRKAQELLGYALYDASSIGGGYLGYHDMGDPMALFD
jgi:ectoine hydroxylase-related dioxygenase (phytanoyl-CoA dioxygenase family)